VRAALWIALALAVAYVALRRGAVLDDAGQIVMAAEDIFYATTQDARENEERYRGHIAAAEARSGLPEGLLHRLIYQESRFRTDIITGALVSSAGAVGIAQIVPRWHPGVNALDPEQSIDYAAGYLARLHNRFGSWQQALAAYNWGPSNVARHVQEFGGLNLDALPPETRNYVAQISGDVGVA